jgi:cell wall assembly regulator SMI1
MSDARHLGYTLGGEPVSAWEQVNAWTGREEYFIEVGRTNIQLDHPEPDLEDTISRSLRKRGQS